MYIIKTIINQYKIICHLVYAENITISYRINNVDFSISGHMAVKIYWFLITLFAVWKQRALYWENHTNGHRCSEIISGVHSTCHRQSGDCVDIPNTGAGRVYSWVST